MSQTKEITTGVGGFIQGVSKKCTPFQIQINRNLSGLKICFSWPSDKMSDDFEFGSDICMHDDVQ